METDRQTEHYAAGGPRLHLHFVSILSLTVIMNQANSCVSQKT